MSESPVHTVKYPFKNGSVPNNITSIVPITIYGPNAIYDVFSVFLVAINTIATIAAIKKASIVIVKIISALAKKSKNPVGSAFIPNIFWEEPQNKPYLS